MQQVTITYVDGETEVLKGKTTVYQTHLQVDVEEAPVSGLISTLTASTKTNIPFTSVRKWKLEEV
jgi:hypothetical protein